MNLVGKGIAVTASATLVFVFYLQLHDGWMPCSLCWVERFALAGVLLSSAGLRWLRPVYGVLLLAAFSLGGLVASLVQWHEVIHPVDVCVISITGLPSCGAAGAHQLMGVPIVEWATAYFAIAIAATGVLALLAQKNPRRPKVHGAR